MLEYNQQAIIFQVIKLPPETLVAERQRNLADFTVIENLANVKV